VSPSKGSELAAIPSAMGTATRLACQRLKEKGDETEPLLRRAGLSPAQIDDPSARLAVKNQIEFLDLAATKLRDDALGFHLGQTFDLRTAGLFYYVLASSDTLHQALERGVRYISIVNEGVKLKLPHTDDLSIIFEATEVPLNRHQIEFSMVTLVRLCRELTNRVLQARRVNLSDHQKHCVSELRTFFGSDVTFGAAVNEVVFPASTKAIPLVKADPYLNDLLVKYCEEAISVRPSEVNPFGSNVEKIIASHLPHGTARASVIARKLGLSERTLARRLSSEGATFAALLQQLKVDLAQRHLADKKLSISEIAWLLGYQDVSAFTHAFKRWTGKPPKVMRRASQ
jgi:AraC-like DNA-binding protein